ncbi:MAG: hypothetical protein C0392_00455 [Syntrophus sp. (in: bacteria)]|nr:hypothetical protein [Syntrophus sp. (in: bacteria)]
MLKEKRWQNLIFLAGDLLAVGICLVFAFHARVWLEGFLNLVELGHGITFYIYKWWVFLVVISMIGYYGGYGTIITIWDDFAVLLRSLFASFLIIWVILSLQKEAETVSRIIVSLSFIYMAVLLPLVRFFIKFILFKTCNQRRRAYLFDRRKGDRSDELKESLNNEWYPGYDIVDKIHIDSLSERIDTCFVPIECSDEETIKTLKQCVENMIIVSSLSGLSFMNTKIRTFMTKNIALITTNNGLLSKQKLIIKRFLDIVLAGAGMIVFMPFLLIIPLLIKIDSRGPVFFYHRRCGMNLEKFDMIKYRTMHIEKGAVMDEYVDMNPEALTELQERNKIKDDPRVTRVGRILRKTSLDELPQFLNVIKGEMSLVGPRPDTKKAISAFLGSYGAIYSRVRPGITGLWQVSGRSDIKYNERVRLDYLYVLNWSIWLDIIIILKTFRAICGGKGAY